MIRRIRQLHNKGGLNEVHLGAKRYLRDQRRDALIWALKHTDCPKETLKSYISCRRKLQPDQYTTADPFKIIWVNPDMIQFRVCNAPTAWGKVDSGNWDRVAFEEHKVQGAPFHQSNVMHFSEGIPWEQTPIYQARLNNFRKGPRKLSTEDRVKKHFESLDAVFISIKKEGYLTQNELLEKDPELAHSTNNDAIHPTLNEVGVNIDHNGELLWSRCGRHRLSFAKILELDEIPIQVRTRHREWESLRRSFNPTGMNSPYVPNYRGHPDMDRSTKSDLTR